MRVSVSQIKNFRLCPTKWYISSILKIKEPEKKATKLGTDFHTAAGHYLRGEWCATDEVKLVNMVENAKPFLDEYKGQSAIIIEKEITGTMCEGITYLGYIDIWNPQTKEVTDLKTGNPDFFLTEHQLPNDLQLNIYAHHQFNEDTTLLDPSSITLTHLQQPTKAPFRTTKISAPVDNSKFHRIWDSAVETAKDMKSVKDNVDDLPWEDIDKVLHKEKSACGKYGGCPYRSVCWEGINPEYLKKELEMLPENHPFTEGNSEMSNKTSFAEKLAKAKGETLIVDESTEVTPEQHAAVKDWANGATVTNVEPPEPTEEAQTMTDVSREIAEINREDDMAKEMSDDLNKKPKKRGRPKKEKPMTATELRKDQEEMYKEAVDKFNAGMVDQLGQAGAKIMKEDWDKQNQKLYLYSAQLSTQFCLGAIPFKSGITVQQFSDILKPFEDKLAGELGLTDIREHKFNEPTKKLCGKKKEILDACKKFEYVFVDERDPVEDMLFRCMDTGDYIVWRGVR